MRTCRLDECYDGQAILGSDFSNAILLGYFSKMSVSNISDFHAGHHHSLVRVDHAPPFCVGMWERIRHGCPLQQWFVSVLENTRRGRYGWISALPPTKHFPHPRSSSHKAVHLSVHIQRKGKVQEMASRGREVVRFGLVLATQT